MMKTIIGINRLQEELGYTFLNRSLLEQALIHSSYANENKLLKIESNERLEFLGDAVLELITSNYLFERYPEMLEGELTKKRASIVCEPTLSKLCFDMQLGNYLLLGKGEELTGGRNRKSILSDALEAIIGGIYLDGGLSAATGFVRNRLLLAMEEEHLFVDSKTELQEFIQSNSDIPVEYLIQSESGPDHFKTFEVVASHMNVIIGFGTGRSKKAAEQEAAKDALKKLKTTE